MEKKPSILMVLLLLAACGTVPPPMPLEKELAGKTAVERRQVLLEECKREARQRVFRKPLEAHDVRDFSARTRLNNLCEAMHKRMTDKTAGNKAALAQSCRKEANLKRIKDNKRTARMNAVCEAMLEEMKN